MRFRYFVLSGFIFLGIACHTDRWLSLEYEAERNFFAAGKSFERLLIHPKAASEEDFVRCRTLFRNFIDRYIAYSDSSKRVSQLVKQAFLNLASLYALEEKFREIISIYNEMIERFASDTVFLTMSYAAKASVYEQLAEYDSAIAVYESLFDRFKGELKENPTRFPPFLLEVPIRIARVARSGNLSGYRERYARARSFYLQIIQKRSRQEDLVGLYQLVAQSYAETGSWEKAAQILNKISSQYADTSQVPYVLLEIGNIYLSKMKNFQKAITYYRKITDRYPYSPPAATAHLYIGDMLFVQNRVKEAREEYRKVIKKFENHAQFAASAQFRIGLTYEKEEDRANAINEYEWLWRKYPLTYEAMIAPNYVGSYLKKTGLNTLAQKAFLRAVDRYKEFLEKYKRSEWTPLAILQLARAYKELGKYQDAVREAQKILADYKNTDAVVDAYRFLGDVYADDLKDINSAKYYYALLLEKFPGYPFAQAVQRKLIQLQ